MSTPRALVHRRSVVMPRWLGCGARGSPKSLRAPPKGASACGAARRRRQLPPQCCAPPQGGERQDGPAALIHLCAEGSCRCSAPISRVASTPAAGSPSAPVHAFDAVDAKHVGANAARPACHQRVMRVVEKLLTWSGCAGAVGEDADHSRIGIDHRGVLNALLILTACASVASCATCGTASRRIVAHSREKAT